jgi:putative FmdB family regulatory protein
MPIYEYQCQGCQHQFEAIQKMSDDALVDCPSCGEPQLRKKISATAFRLKGNGWYETDFKTGGKKNLAGDSSENKSAGSSESSSGSSSSGSSDSAAASK